MNKIRLGLMGFGETNRHLYRLCLNDERFEIVAISDIGRPEVLHYLLRAEVKNTIDVKLDGNNLVSANGKARMLPGRLPGDVPWDAFGVDFVVDGTGKFLKRAEIEDHLKAGAGRVVIATLPTDEIDRVVIMGVNDQTIQATDRIISVGSATTNAAALMIKTLDDAFGVDYAMLLTIHNYTADQPLRDVVGNDFRRSRSAAQNIIPNVSPAPAWIEKILPQMKGRIEGSALNVPIPAGSLLDLSTFLRVESIDLAEVHKAVEAAAAKIPHIIEVTSDEIVSVDIIGNPHSIIYDKNAAMRSPGRIVKTISWYHTSLAVAARIKDLISAYNNIN